MSASSLMWSMDSVRELFRDYRMWPTFVGYKLIYFNETRSTLPVLVWNEQKRYCEENKYSDVIGCSMETKSNIITSEMNPDNYLPVFENNECNDSSRESNNEVIIPQTGKRKRGEQAHNKYELDNNPKRLKSSYFSSWFGKFFSTIGISNGVVENPHDDKTLWTWSSILPSFSISTVFTQPSSESIKEVSLDADVAKCTNNDDTDHGLLFNNDNNIHVDLVSSTVEDCTLSNISLQATTVLSASNISNVDNMNSIYSGDDNRIFQQQHVNCVNVVDDTVIATGIHPIGCVTTDPNSPTITTTNNNGTTANNNKTDDNDNDELVRYKIFSAIQRQNKYFIGPADVYGGDYSLYKGSDPTQSHSTATVRIVSHGHKITARELLAFSRVQNHVAKSAVFAFIDKQRHYQPTTNSNNNCMDEQRHNSCSSSDDDTMDNGSVMHTSKRGGNDDDVEGGEEEVGFIVINFKNVSDRI